MAQLHYHDHHIDIEPGQDVLGALLEEGANIGYICMAGSCGTCLVTVEAGAEHLQPTTPMETSHGCSDSNGKRLACQAIMIGDGDVRVVQ